MPVGEVYCWGETERADPFLEGVRGSVIRSLVGSDHGVVITAAPPEGPTMLHGGGEAPPRPGDAHVVEAHFGDGFSLYRTEDGSVYACGTGRQGQLGLGGKTWETAVPLRLGALRGHRARKLSCGAAHSACITEGGDLFTWGKGFRGQLGHTSSVLPPDVSRRLHSLLLEPKAVPSLMRKTVTDVSCGSMHTACVTSDGEVYTFGEGSCGQLGIGRRASVGTPAKALPTATIAGAFDMVACGWAHTLVRSRNGELWSFGLNAHGQLGVGDTESRCVPERIRSDLLAEPATSIAARGSFSAALLGRSGRLLSWGCGDGGRLGQRGEGAALGRLVAGGSEHRCTPGVVSLLGGKRASAFCLGARAAYALVPTSVYRLAPRSGARSGGTRIALHGAGFWASDRIVVKFTPQSGDRPARCAIGSFAGEEPGGLQRITASMPDFADCTPLTVEVSLNGRDFTDSGQTFRPYEVPEILSLEPHAARREAEAAQVTIHLRNAPPAADQLLVRFTEQAGPDAPRECTVEGRAVEEGSPEMDEAGAAPLAHGATRIVCGLPTFEDALPVACSVSVAFNGRDFHAAPGHFFVLHSFRGTAVEPSLVPAEDETELLVSGESFFDAPRMAARLLVGDAARALDGADPAAAAAAATAAAAASVPVAFVDATTLSCRIAPRALEGDRSPACLQVSADGEAWGDPMPFQLYAWPRPRVRPTCGPASGGTELRVTLPNAKRLVGDRRVLVRVASAHPNGSFSCELEATQCPDAIAEAAEDSAAPLERPPPDDLTVSVALPAWAALSGAAGAGEAAGEAARENAGDCEVIVSVSVDGRRFTPHAAPFTYYGAAAFHSVDGEAFEPGEVATISARGLALAPESRAVLACAPHGIEREVRAEPALSEDGEGLRVEVPEDLLEAAGEEAAAVGLELRVRYARNGADFQDLCALSVVPRKAKRKRKKKK